MKTFFGNQSQEAEVVDINSTLMINIQAIISGIHSGYKELQDRDTDALRLESEARADLAGITLNFDLIEDFQALKFFPVFLAFYLINALNFSKETIIMEPEIQLMEVYSYYKLFEKYASLMESDELSILDQSGLAEIFLTYQSDTIIENLIHKDGQGEYSINISQCPHLKDAIDTCIQNLQEYGVNLELFDILLETHKIELDLNSSMVHTC